MDKETLKQIQYILDCIENYMNGDDKYYNDMIDLIIALDDYTKDAKVKSIKFKMLSILSKLTTFIACPKLYFDEYYGELTKNIDDDLIFYNEAVISLKKYIKYCIKKNEFPDLDAAYLLSIKISLVYQNMMEYFSYIRSLENRVNNGLCFITRVDFKREHLENKEEVLKLLNVTNQVYLNQKKED